MSRKYGVGIVGLGWVAGQHVKVYKENINTEVVAVCGRNLEKAEKFREELDLINAKVYDDYQKMLEQDDLEIISICTPNYLHAEEGILAAQAKKHLYIEKPVAITLDSLYSLQDEINKSGIKSMVSFEGRESPLLKIIKSLVDSGSIGNIFYSEIDYRSGMLADWYSGFDWSRKKKTGGSSFLVAGCHAIDNMRWFLGEEAVEVCAYSGGWDKRYEYDATIVAIIKFSNGIVGKSLSSIELNMPYGFNIELYGDEGTIINHDLFSLRLMKGQTDFTRIPCIGPESSDVKYHPFEPAINHLIDCILKDKTPMIDINDAVKTHEICFAADISAEKGKPIKLPLK